MDIYWKKHICWDLCLGESPVPFIQWMLLDGISVLVRNFYIIAHAGLLRILMCYGCGSYAWKSDDILWEGPHHYVVELLPLAIKVLIMLLLTPFCEQKKNWVWGWLLQKGHFIKRWSMGLIPSSLPPHFIIFFSGGGGGPLMLS